MAEIDPEDKKVVLRFLRSVHDWTQADLASKSGFSAGTIGRWERDGEVPWETVELLALAAGVPGYVLRSLVLPAVHAVRCVAFLSPQELATTYPNLGVILEGEAQEGAEATRAHFRSFWEHVATLEREEKANAWRPTEDHREAASALWERLESSTAEERDELLLYDYGEIFRSWAIVEHVAGLVAESAKTDPQHALELAELAFRIAALVPGDEVWVDRVRGYGLASLGHALRAAGRQVDAEETFRMAVEHWKLGASMPGLLEEERFQALLEGWQSPTP